MGWCRRGYRAARGTILLAVVAAGSFHVGVSLALAACPPMLDQATRLILATTPTPDHRSGVMRLFERSAPGGVWQRTGRDIRMVTGLKGLAWGWTATQLAKRGELRKREGDKRTPAGVFGIGRPFGSSNPDELAGFLKLQTGRTFCVDDVRSPYYGQIVPRAQAGRGMSGEVMAKYQIYRRGLVVNYPPNAGKRAGSCIFIHVWRGPGRGTAGCIATSQRAVERLQRFTNGHRSAVAILPETALARLGACLPE